MEGAVRAGECEGATEEEGDRSRRKTTGVRLYLVLARRDLHDTVVRSWISRGGWQQENKTEEFGATRVS
jgi:hypothetical protein